MAAEYIDLSQSLSATTQIYPGDPAFACCSTQTILKDGINVQSISMGSHTGTHIDAPYHFFETGLSIEQLPLSTFIGNAVVVDLTGKPSKHRIAWADLSVHEQTIRHKTTLEHGAFVLLNTGWSRFWGEDRYYDHPFLEPDAAKKLIELGVKVIGVDTLSPDETRIDGTTPDFGVHKVVLGAGAILAENLTNLEAIRTGDWLVHLVPLKLDGSDGSPVRAFAHKTSQAESTLGTS